MNIVGYNAAISACAKAGDWQRATTLLTPGQVKAVLFAAGRLVDPNFGAGKVDEATVADMHRRLGKAVPWLGRKPIDEAAQRFISLPRLDVDAFVEAVDFSTVRAAALLAGDLPAVIDLLRRLEQGLSSHRGAALFEASPRIGDLVRFWVTDTAHEVRKSAGLI